MSRLGRLFHTACHERHLAIFESALRRIEQPPAVPVGIAVGPPIAALHLI